MRSRSGHMGECCFGSKATATSLSLSVNWEPESDARCWISRSPDPKPERAACVCVAGGDVEAAARPSSRMGVASGSEGYSGMSSCGCRPPAAGHHLSVVRSGPSRSPTEALRSVLLLGVGHRRRSRGERFAGEHLLRDPELPSSPNRDRVAPTGGPGCRGRLVLTATGDLLRLVRERGCREEHHRPPVRVRDLMAAPPRRDHCNKSPEAPGLTRTGHVAGSRSCSFRAEAAATGPETRPCGLSAS
jgi:hypothetical protein